jgi:hypothetical protein
VKLIKGAQPWILVTVRVRAPRQLEHIKDPIIWLRDRWCGLWCRAIDWAGDHRHYRLQRWIVAVAEKLTPNDW